MAYANEIAPLTKTPLPVMIRSVVQYEFLDQNRARSRVRALSRLRTEDLYQPGELRWDQCNANILWDLSLPWA